eukprot:CAMPEP_0172488130 /NCGR_PEP_ID=MMETSP1066-20121228/17518_1 /TAXON_ID=671091 /ORGANISM="Coscinodiscus wailesii, Strain CCMP2513" /LENGTH=42 /DNA_ID= /DNA_START= /DNA_END= /DNA_ORIENTATION=
MNVVVCRGRLSLVDVTRRRPSSSMSSFVMVVCRSSPPRAAIT